MNKVKRYIPTLVYDKLQTLNYKNIDHLYHIIHTIYMVNSRSNSDDYSNSYIDIPQYYFIDVISNKISYKEAIDTLKSNDIIECDNHYSKSAGKALGYRVNVLLTSKLIPVYIQKDIVAKKICRNKNERNNLVSKLLKPYRDNFINTFKIDIDKAMICLEDSYDSLMDDLNNSMIPRDSDPNNISTYLNSSYVVHFEKNPLIPSDTENYKNNEKYMLEFVKINNKYNKIYMSINSIADGDLYFSKNKTNGRIDTNLTSLKSEYKKFIISDMDLTQIDIINSQPFILSLYLKTIISKDISTEQQDELDKYYDWTSRGFFYENFLMTYYKNTGKEILRKEIKDIMFCIFYSKNGSYVKEKKIFKSIFPFILQEIEKQKLVKHNEFAIKLQQLESEICIDIICQELDNRNIKYYTIHDAWLVDKNNVSLVKSIIESEFNKKYGSKPSLKIEKIK